MKLGAGQTGPKRVRAAAQGKNIEVFATREELAGWDALLTDVVRPALLEVPCARLLLRRET